MKPDEYAKVAEKWDSYYNDHPVTAAEDRLITSVVRELYEKECRGVVVGMKMGFPGRPVSVLDIGCGTGMVLEHVRFRPDDYMGIDVSPTMLKVAKKKFPKHAFYVDDAEEMGLVTDNSINLLLYLFGVFPFTNPSKSLPEVFRVLKLGAIFAITFYHKTFPMAGEDGYQAAFYANNLVPPMAKFYTVKEAKALVNAQLGLVVDKVVTINSYLNKYEKLIPSSMRMRVLRKLAVKESKFFSRRAPELCHHFMLIGRKVTDA